MSKTIDSPSAIPEQISDWWHDRWCQILSEEHRKEILAAGLPGSSFTERAPDAPGGRGGFSFAIIPRGHRRSSSSDWAAPPSSGPSSTP